MAETPWEVAHYPAASAISVDFFFIPFGFALGISFADTAVRVPPFTTF